MDQASSPGSEISQLLARWRAGDAAAQDSLFSAVYDELRRRARQQLARHRHATLNTTALVHEAFLKLVDSAQASWADRTHFFAVASLAMRQILVDYARRRLAQKRGGGVRVEELDEFQVRLDDRAVELLALNTALDRLKALDERMSRLVDLRFFGGLSFEESAEVLDVSPRTLKREWRKARAFLYEALEGGATA